MNRSRKIARQYTQDCKPERPSFVPVWADLTRDALRAAAHRHGIVYRTMRKPEIVEALTAIAPPAVVRPAKGL